MPTLSRDHRRLLETNVTQARTIAVDGARKVLTDQYAVHHHEPWPHMTSEERELRNQLRAHGRQLGDRRDDRRDTQEIDHLVQACAYEHWHRMLFARFLAENDLLLDAEHGMAMTLGEVRELAREQNRDWLEIAAELAQKMLLAVFRSDDPVLRVSLPPETRQQMEQKLATLPAEVFRADDSLGWVYQFWQRDEKDRVNKSEVKIGADELPAVTQLFTEDYMVLFLLENTLGAWWTAKRQGEAKNPSLPGYEWSYLRLKDDGSPAAGSFDDWPRVARDLRILDPCMGSGHFLVFALPILARMRMEEEGLSLKESFAAVLQENLYGLEIDARCAQIAAFNLAVAAWRAAGEHFPLPQLNLACSGMGPNCTKEQWLKLTEDVAITASAAATTHAGAEAEPLSEPLKRTMGALHELFSLAPLLGSLINPTKVRGNLFQLEYDAAARLFRDVLHAERNQNDTRERLIAAEGMVKAADLLSRQYTLVLTNVPFLGGHKQSPEIADYLRTEYDTAGGNLANAVFMRLIEFLKEGMSIAVVTPQDWMLSGRYSKLRELVLPTLTSRALAFLGTRAFETIDGEVVTAALSIWDKCNFEADHASPVLALDVQSDRPSSEKAKALATRPVIARTQNEWLSNPSTRITVEVLHGSVYLSRYARPWQGIKTSDDDRFVTCFWEHPHCTSRWKYFLRALGDRDFSGREHLLLWEEGRGQLRELSRSQSRDRKRDLQGMPAWGRIGVAVNTTGKIVSGLYLGEAFASEVVVLTTDEKYVKPILDFTRSGEFVAALKKLDKRVSITTSTFSQVPFEVEMWGKIADGGTGSELPRPETTDPTQWFFSGHPRSSESPLQVAVARLLGYRWPRQTGSEFPDCPALDHDGLEHHADADGIVPLNAIAGESSAADRLRVLLADAYSGEWSAAKLKELLGKWETLEEWLRDGFFDEHSRVFHHNPFIWHVWDGRKDGFHALINYHNLAGANGEAGRTLEKLIYTYLGRWIDRQNDEVRAGNEGADARLAAALHLKTELVKILLGEKPYDVFVRWKPIHEQAIGWEPDINDGVRLNIRPWLTAKPYQPGRRDGCILRVTPRVNYAKDRGEEPHRSRENFPWFWSWDEQTEDFVGGKDFDGARWNDLHYSLDTKRKARERSKQAGANA